MRENWEGKYLSVHFSPAWATGKMRRNSRQNVAGNHRSLAWLVDEDGNLIGGHP